MLSVTSWGLLLLLLLAAELLLVGCVDLEVVFSEKPSPRRGTLDVREPGSPALSIDAVVRKLAMVVHPQNRESVTGVIALQ